MQKGLKTEHENVTAVLFNNTAVTFSCSVFNPFRQDPMKFSSHYNSSHHFRRDLHLVPEILTPNMSHGSALSAYELVRLENIRKNNEFLAQLGLFPPAPKLKVKVEERVIQEKKKRTRLEREPSPVVRRKSSRLSGQFQSEDIVSLEDEVKKPTAVNDDIPFYDRIAQDSHELDDFEFQAFVELRKWRLLRSRELNWEPFKIFQNRTLCDMIRLRRNDPTWAVNVTGTTTVGAPENAMETNIVTDEATTSSSQSQSVSTSPPKGRATSQIRTTDMLGGGLEIVPPEESSELQTLEADFVRYDPTLIDALTDCFGIAAGKTRKGGFAWEALAVLNGKNVTHLLEKSRLLQPGLMKS